MGETVHISDVFPQHKRAINLLLEYATSGQVLTDAEWITVENYDDIVYGFHVSFMENGVRRRILPEVILEDIIPENMKDAPTERPSHQ
jgi:hypothetical protein